MAKVQLLDEPTIARIAAGEVVERPASAVKELVENAIDAGARSIAIEAQRGGTSLLRVTDDGEGMSPEDLRLALQRHATSKLRPGDDLTSIATMGFRGEALSAIAAVSRITIETMPATDRVGSRVLVAGGEIVEAGHSGGPAGTRVTVEDLFFNTPARRKFLRSIAAEASSIVGVVSDAMLAWPGIAFRLTLGESVRLLSQGDGDLASVAAQVLGAGLSRDLTVIPPEPLAHLPFSVGGLLGPAGTGIPTRRAIKVLVNRRPVRSASLTRAIVEGFRNALPVGLFPVAVLSIEAPLELVDVNIHPAKIEVKIQQSSRLEGAIIRWVAGQIAGRAGPRSWTAPGAPRPGAPRPHPAVAAWGTGFPGATGAPRPGPDEPSDLDAFLGPLAGAPGPHPRTLPGQTATGGPVPRTPAATLETTGRIPAVVGPAPAALVGGDAGRIPGLDLGAVTVLGQALETYIVATDGQAVYLFDQHVVHERVLFERALDRLSRPSIDTQRLLFPVTIPLATAQEEEMREALPVLARHGFETEVYSGPTLVMTAMPVLDDRLDPAAIAAALVVETAGIGRMRSDEALRRLSAVIACRGAVKAGDPLPGNEAAALLRQLAAARQPATCPHGRPAALRISREELGRFFLRC